MLRLARIVAVTRSDGPYAFSFMFRRTGPPCCVVPSDSVVPANEDSRITGIAALTTAPPPSRRRRCLREMSITRLGSRLGERRESHDQGDGGAVDESAAVRSEERRVGKGCEG